MLEALKRTFTFIHQHPFASRYLFRAYTEFFRWQFQSAFNKDFIVKPFVGDVKFWAKKGLTGITGNIYCGLHEFEDMGFLLHFLRPEDTFYDIGANVGSYTLLASGIAKSNTVCFEPSAGTFQTLSNNIRLNTLEERVRAYNLALGNEAGFLNFTEGEDTTNHVLKESDIAAFSKVEVARLDDLNEKTPSLIKIDVEGFETEVLKGANAILHDPTFKAIIIELNGSGYRYGFDEKDIHQKLVDLGFAPYQYHPFDRSLNKLDGFTAFNTIYIRDLSFVEERLKTAKAFRLWNQYI